MAFHGNKAFHISLDCLDILSKVDILDKNCCAPWKVIPITCRRSDYLF